MFSFSLLKCLFPLWVHVFKDLQIRNVIKRGFSYIRNWLLLYIHKWRIFVKLKLIILSPLNKTTWRILKKLCYGAFFDKRAFWLCQPFGLWLYFFTFKTLFVIAWSLGSSKLSIFVDNCSGHFLQHLFDGIIFHTVLMYEFVLNFSIFVD